MVSLSLICSDFHTFGEAVEGIRAQIEVLEHRKSLVAEKRGVNGRQVAVEQGQTLQFWQRDIPSRPRKIFGTEKEEQK